jgi:hypothetical protein
VAELGKDGARVELTEEVAMAAVVAPIPSLPAADSSGGADKQHRGEIGGGGVLHLEGDTWMREGWEKGA